MTAKGMGVLMAVKRRYNFREFGCHLGNAGLACFKIRPFTIKLVELWDVGS